MTECEDHVQSDLWAELLVHSQLLLSLALLALKSFCFWLHSSSHSVESGYFLKITLLRW